VVLSLANIFLEHFSGPLSEELARVVGELERLASVPG
jgi:hypothetical protein